MTPVQIDIARKAKRVVENLGTTNNLNPRGKYWVRGGPIAFATWHDVGNEFRDMLWTMIKHKFIVLDEARKLALITMGKDWREHKVQKRKVIDIEDDLEQALVNCHEDETRRKHIEVRKKHKLPHACSRLGYPHLKHKMDQIDAGKVDLTVLFSPERIGRIRVTGFDISPMVYNSIQHSGVLVQSLQEEVKELREKVVLVQGLKDEVTLLRVQMAKLENFMPNQLSALDETTLQESNRLASQGNHIPSRPIKYKLFWLTPSNVVATGHWYNEEPTCKVHNVPLGIGMSKPYGYSLPVPSPDKGGGKRIKIHGIRYLEENNYCNTEQFSVSGKIPPVNLSLKRGVQFMFDYVSSLTTSPDNYGYIQAVDIGTTANGSSGTGVGIPNMRYQFQPEMVRLDLNYAAKIPMKAITDALCGLESLNSQEVLSVFDIILRQHASRKLNKLYKISVKTPSSKTDYKITGLGEHHCSKQLSSLVEKSRQKPKESLSVLSDTLEIGKYDDDQMLMPCDIKTNLKLTQVKGCVLSDPKLAIGRISFLEMNGGTSTIRNFHGMWFPIFCTLIVFIPCFVTAQCLNSMLTTEHGLNILVISKALAMMLGMDVSHGSPGQADVPSISAMVSSRRQWSSISRYRACVRTLSPKVKMVVALFKRDSNIMDADIIRELLLDFYTSSGKRKPDQIIVFR
ncbi:hypothetical protein GIB67_004963 [Kingdonia uniflora]|uniref:Piwi domain-containing protein n=1 Tax=Kingdonia uniflora TaxID=39325 RepID=A0A7J7NMF5_9MAGN|nr:hypothetical protein GIB67_004963 [Kingdonia uniflora]